jgi:hypothetical protein
MMNRYLIFTRFVGHHCSQNQELTHKAFLVSYLQVSPTVDDTSCLRRAGRIKVKLDDV